MNSRNFLIYEIILLKIHVFWPASLPLAAANRAASLCFDFKVEACETLRAEIFGTQNSNNLKLLTPRTQKLFTSLKSPRRRRTTAVVQLKGEILKFFEVEH